MTAKEQLLKEAPHWSEAQAAVALRMVHGNEDPWGDLETWGDAVTRGVFSHLDEQEAKAGFSWEKYR
ncbi:MAG: hypothetical protein ACM3N0_09360 [Chloroflexota bacterium]